MKPNPGYCPQEARGQRVNVRLANGSLGKGSWAADGKSGCRWSITGSPYDIKEWEIAK